MEIASCSWRGRRKMSGLLLIPPSCGFLRTTLTGSVFRACFAQGCCALRISLGRMEAWQWLLCQNKLLSGCSLGTWSWDMKVLEEHRVCCARNVHYRYVCSSSGKQSEGALPEQHNLTALRPCIPVCSASDTSQRVSPFTLCCCPLSAAPHFLGQGSFHHSPAAHPSLKVDSSALHSWVLLPPILPLGHRQSWGKAVQ